MQGERFFSMIWRINALLILGVGVLAAVVLSVGAYHLYSDLRRPRNVDGVAATSAQKVDDQHVELGPFQSVPGADVVRAPLLQMQTYGVGAITKAAGSTVDYLYVDPATRSSHWLRPGRDGLILRTISVPRHGSRGQIADTVVEVHAIVEQDSNGDARLSQRDRHRIAVSDPKGRGFRVIVEAADRLLDARMVDDDRVLVLYMLASRAMAAEMDVRTPDAPMRIHELATLAR